MASGIINWVIGKYLSNILEINKDLTKSSLFTGELKMENLKIKPEIFTILNLPFFELVHGYLGKLRVKAKMPRIHLHPIKVEIENIFFHAKQKKLSNINKESEIKFMEAFKGNSLTILEELKNQLNNCQDEIKANMVSKIINNIEIYISNICIRFDDNISYSLTPFCFGVIIKNIKIKSVDKDFKEVEGKYSIPFGEINNKIIQIDYFSVFLDTFEAEGKLVEYDKRIVDTDNTIITDEKFRTFLGPMLNYYRYCLSEIYEHFKDDSSHSYILHNLGILIKASINENMKNGKPKIMLDCLINGINLELNLIQIKAFVKLSIYQNLMLKYQSGLKKIFYVKKLTEGEKMEYIDNYMNYYRYMYGKKQNEKKGNKIKSKLRKVEKGLLYEEIQIMRNAAEAKMRQLDEIEEVDKKLKEMKNEGKLFKRINFKKKNKEEEEEKEKEKKKQIDELELKKAELEKSLPDVIKHRLDHIELLSGLFPDATDNFSLMSINLEIPEIQLCIKRTREEKLFTLILKKFNSFGDLKNREQNIKLTINDMSLLQYQLPESKYQMIMTTVEQKNEDFGDEKTKEINACDIELNNNPEFEKSNLKIKFRNQKRYILIANIYSLQYIGKKFADYLTFFMDKTFDFPEKYDCSGEIYRFIKDGFIYDSMQVSFQHFNADLDVTIKGPMVLFPIDILDNRNKKCILVRCGDLEVSSILPPREDKFINYNEVKDRKKLIDTYKVKSDKLRVTTLENFNGDLSRLLIANGSNLIEDLSFDLTADIMFANNNPYFEKFKVGMNIGKFRVNIRDKQLPFFMELIEKSGKMIKLVMYTLEKKTYFEKKEIKFNKEEEETYNINNKKKKKLKEGNKEINKEENKEIENNEIENEEDNIDIKEYKLDDFLVDEDEEEEDKKEKDNDEEDEEEINEHKKEEKENQEDNAEIKEYNLNDFLDVEEQEKNENEEKNEDKIIKEENQTEENNKENKEDKYDDKKENENKKEEKKEEGKNEEKDIKEKNEIQNKDLNENEKNKNTNEIIPKKKENIEKKLLTFIFHLEEFQFCLQKTISYGERQILLKTNNDNYKNLFYRDFIIFDMNNLKIELCLTEKLNANAILLIKSISIIDKETLITNSSNPEGDLYIDKEFQNIIKMDSGDNNNIFDRTSSHYSFRASDFREDSIVDSVNRDNTDNNDNNENNDMNNNQENYDEYFMVLNFQHNNETQTQNADISLKKINICIALNTMGRILQFSFYYLEMFNKIIEDNLILWNNMKMEHKKEKLKNKIIRRKSKLILQNLNDDVNEIENNNDDEYSDSDDDLDSIDSDDEMSRLFDSILSNKMAEDIKNKDKEDEENLFIIDTSSNQNNKNKENELNNNIYSNIITTDLINSADKEAEQTLKNKEIKLSKIFRTKNRKLNIKMKFELRETSIIFPLDDTKSATKVLRVKSNINGNTYFKTNIDIIRDGNEKLVQVNFIENILKTGIKILNIEFGILNYKNEIYSIENICDKILTEFRLCINVNSILLLPEKEQTVTLANIDLEPLVFNIGFSQIKSFIKFMPILLEFMRDIKREYDDPIKEIEDYEEVDFNNDDNINNEKDSNNDIINDEINILNLNEEVKKKEENKKYDEDWNFERNILRTKTKKKKKKKMKLVKKEKNGPQINILKMNNTIDVKINMEKTLIKIIDDSGYYLEPLSNIEFWMPPIRLILNTNSDSVHNISNLLLESISRKEISIKEYDIKNMALYGELKFVFSVTYYNNRIEDWEPIIERYSASITIDQIAWFSRLRVLYQSNDMLNINASFSILSMVNDVLKRILIKEEKIQKLNDVAPNIDDRVAIEFINLSGIDITCWLDADDTISNNEDFSKNYKYNLDSDIDSKKHKKIILRSKLNKIYRKLSVAQLKIKKDKFSFKVKGFLPITANDFSSNYTTCLKLQRDSKERFSGNNLNINLEIDKKEKEANEEEDEIIGEESNLLTLKEKLLPKQSEEDNIICTSSKPKEDILINEAPDEEEISIFIKIRKNGSLKSIVFESNLFFYNNLQIPISLSFISQRDFNLKYKSNNDLINHEKNNHKIVINSGIKISISLIYLIKQYRIYISFHDNSNKEKYNYSLLYENFNQLKNNYQNFIKYVQENLPTYKGKKETELEDFYSKLISINHKNKKFYICSNLIIQHGSNDIIKDFQENEAFSSKKEDQAKIKEHFEVSLPAKQDKNNNVKKFEYKMDGKEENLEENEDNINANIDLFKEIKYTKSFSYLFILNESLVIENQLPFNIKCELKENVTKEVIIRPLQNKYFLDINQENTSLKLVLKYQKKIFESHSIDIKTIGENENQNRENRANKDKKKDEIETTVKLFEKDENTNIILDNKFIECNIKMEENIENEKFIGAYEKEFEHNVKSFGKKRKIIIYNKCLIINKTDFLLFMRSHDIKRQNFNFENYNGRIFPNCINLLNTKDVKNTFKLKHENSDWSEKFNINTIGHIGVISLDISYEYLNSITNLEMGVSISSSWDFPNSLFITIEPRFILINKFGYDLEYKQYNNKKDKRSNDQGTYFQSHILKNGEELKLNLLKDSKNMKKMIQIKMKEFSPDYSCPVDLNEVGDVDIKIHINEEMKQQLLKKNIEIEKKIEKMKKKERLKRKLQNTEEKAKEEENKKESEEKNDSNNNNLIVSNNGNEYLINTDNDNIINTQINENQKIDNSKNLEKIINIDNIISNNANNQIFNSDNYQNEIKNPELSFSESDRTSTLDDELLEGFSFAKKIEKFLSRKNGQKELTPAQERIKRIEERSRKLQEVKMSPRKYYIFSQNNESYLLIRVTKSVYKGLIYIVLFPPEHPQYMIKNQTDVPISIRQKKDAFLQENIILEKGVSIPYSWGDTLKDEKLLYVSIDNNDVEINLNEIKVLRKRLKIHENLLLAEDERNDKIRLAFFFQTIIENNRTRTLIIKSTHKEENNKISFIERLKEQKKNSFNIKVKLYTKGFGISIINNVPKELFYISLYGFLVESQLFSFNKDQCTHIIANVKMSLKNFQIDYCLKDLFKSMIIPKTQITPQVEGTNLDNILTPFFQGIISFHRTINQIISVSSDEFPQLDFTMQPLKVNVSNYQLVSLLDMGLKLKDEFDFYSTEPEKNTKFENIEDLEKFLFEENSNLEVPEYEPYHYESLLNYKLTVLPEEIIFDSEKHYMFFIKNIAMGSIVIILTTRLDLNSINLIPTIFAGLSSFIGNIFTHITDYNLYLPSLYYTDVFTDPLILGAQFGNSYLSQLKKRVFTIVGSLDILGNPTGYASSIGQGFLEIFESPRRGLINGPLGFGEGVAKGFGNFITTVISSSFDIVGKISGTLLASFEELQGIKTTDYLSEREPSNLFSGLYYGVKNGIKDIGKGISGIIIRPYKEAKKSGFGGLIQGIGAGLLGAAVSPVTAGLRIANNLIIGLKNTALIFNPKLKTERFRYPRTIHKAIRLNSYDEDEALIRAILDYLKGYEDHEIIYFKQFKYINPGLKGNFSTLILTDKCVIIVYQAKELVFKLSLDLIERVEVHKEPNNTNIDLIFYLHNNSRKYIRTNDKSLCVDFYLMFENFKE